MSVKAIVRLLAFASPVLALSSQDSLDDNFNYDATPYTVADADAFDHGNFGFFPTVHFRSTDLVSPRVLKRTWDPICNDDSYYYFFSPYGRANEHPGPMILDYNGQMVWHDENYPRSYGLTVQEYHGEPYLTWWTGDDSIKGHGIGNYYMLDSSYRLKAKLGALNNLPADLHEFYINDNTVIVTSFANTRYDLSKYGKARDGYIWDGVFQEYNLDTNEVIFEWHSSKHIEMDDCLDLRETLEPDTGNKDQPWDYFHINSVDKDDKGNYLVSARYCALTYVNGKTGDVIWKLGGANNSFAEPDGVAIDFAFQHHARWENDYKTITMFDNRATDKYGHDQPSRGLKLDVDQKAMTVRKVHDYIHPSEWIGESQGSMQRLDNGHYLLGFGHAAAITQFFPDGQVACDIQFAAIHWNNDGANHGGKGQSYRVFKKKWVGKPYYDPKVFFDDTHMYVSWNGATEVRIWQLEGSSDRASWTTLGNIPKTGFETKITVRPSSSDYTIFRITAFDKKGDVLGRWSTWSTGAVQAIPQSVPTHKLYQWSARGFFVVFLAFLTGVATSVFMIRWCRRHGSRRKSGTLLDKALESGWAMSGDFKSQQIALLHDQESELESH